MPTFCNGGKTSLDKYNGPMLMVLLFSCILRRKHLLHNHFSYTKNRNLNSVSEILLSEGCQCIKRLDTLNNKLLVLLTPSSYYEFEIVKRYYGFVLFFTLFLHKMLASRLPLWMLSLYTFPQVLCVLIAIIFSCCAPINRVRLEIDFFPQLHSE